MSDERVCVGECIRGCNMRGVLEGVSSGCVRSTGTASSSERGGGGENMRGVLVDVRGCISGCQNQGSGPGLICRVNI